MSLDLRPLPPVQQHNFARVPRAEIQRSVFDRSHGWKGTFNEAELIPFYVDEALPGDTFSMDCSVVARMSTPLHPLMDNLYMDFFFFSCPNRLLWDNWEKFMGAQDDPGDSIDFTIPQLSKPAGGDHAIGSVADYFGLRAGTTGSEAITVNALPFRMLNKVWNEWFRDQNLQNSVTENTGNGPDTYTDYAILKRNKRPDYFSTALPWPQKGDAVEIPLGDYAPVKGIGKGDTTWTATNQNVWETKEPLIQTYNPWQEISGAGTLGAKEFFVERDPSTTEPWIRADLSAATSATINEWREAFQLQRFLERDARSGTRYCEVIQAHFGVTDPSHAVLQRSEYIGGGTAPIQITPVAQTSESGTTDQGHLTGVGYVEKDGVGFTKSFTEHCTIIGLLNVRGTAGTYQQGTDRMWSRSTRYDFYTPVLAHLGEQEILNKEIYTQDTAADDNVFGYQERWAEYRMKRSVITGAFRSDYATSLDPWHLSIDFSSLPVLNSSFIEEAVPVSRVVAAPSEPRFLCDAWLKLRCARPMPVFSVPGQIDHF